MPKGYVILTEAIKDPEGMKAYGRAAGAAMGGVNILAVDTKAATSSKAIGMATRLSCWSSNRWMLPARGTSPTPTRKRRSYGKPRPTATRSSSPGLPEPQPLTSSRTPISSQIGPTMNKPPRGVQNGCGGSGDGGGGGGGLKTGAGTSASTKLPSVVPPKRTLPWPIGTMYQVWHTPMSHSRPRYGNPCPGHQE